MFFRSKLAAAGAGLYLLAFIAAAIYPMTQNDPFAFVFVVMLALPWIEYLPKGQYVLPIAAILNTVCIYIILAALVAIVRGLRRG